jgi:hypothetical protein
LLSSWSDTETLRVNLDWRSGIAAKDHTELLSKDELAPLEDEMRFLEKRGQEILRELEYQRQREEEHRNTNGRRFPDVPQLQRSLTVVLSSFLMSPDVPFAESTNTRLMWFSVLTMVVMLSLSVFQVVYLHRYFRHKKMI